jgi:hypothetical protein
VIRKLSIGVVAFGLIIHVYTYIFKAQNKFDFETFGFLLMALMPYIICLIIILTKNNSVMPLTGSILPLLIDTFTYYSVFIKPSSSTASLALLWMPIWNMLLILPLGLLIGYGIEKDIKKNRKAS